MYHKPPLSLSLLTLYIAEQHLFLIPQPKNRIPGLALRLDNGYRRPISLTYFVQLYSLPLTLLFHLITKRIQYLLSTTPNGAEEIFEGRHKRLQRHLSKGHFA